jgi:hypothetical protein
MADIVVAVGRAMEKKKSLDINWSDLESISTHGNGFPIRGITKEVERVQTGWYLITVRWISFYC